MVFFDPSVTISFWMLFRSLRTFFFGLSSVLASFHFGNFFLVVCSLLLKGKVKVLSYLKGNSWDKIVRSRLYACILQRSLFLLEKKRSQFSLLPNSIFTGRPSILGLRLSLADIPLISGLRSKSQVWRKAQNYIPCDIFNNSFIRLTWVGISSEAVVFVGKYCFQLFLTLFYFFFQTEFVFT